jgi:hypothetical protein
MSGYIVLFCFPLISSEYFITEIDNNKMLKSAIYIKNGSLPPAPCPLLAPFLSLTE